jgi:hypothetical protein
MSMMPPGGIRRIDQKLIHRSAWKGNSRKSVWIIGLPPRPYRVQALFPLSAEGKTRLYHRLDCEIDDEEAEGQRG